MTTYTDHKNWVIEFDKLKIADTLNFDIGPIKKEDVLATVKKISGRFHAQVYFHGSSCTVRKLSQMNYYVTQKRIDKVSNYDGEYLDIVEQAKVNIESNARMRQKIKEYKKILTKDQVEEVRLICLPIFTKWRENKKNGLPYGPTE